MGYGRANYPKVRGTPRNMHFPDSMDSAKLPTRKRIIETAMNV